jgi:hypothetical protein
VQIFSSVHPEYWFPVTPLRFNLRPIEEVQTNKQQMHWLDGEEQVCIRVQALEKEMQQ